MNMTHAHLRSKGTRNLALACAAIALAVAAPARAAGIPKAYRFTSSATNTAGHMMTLDNPALNGKPTLRLLVTQYFTGVYNPHPVGLFYDEARQKWMIANDDLAAIPVNANFNVMVAPGAKRVDVTPKTLHGIYNILTIQKGNPDAVLLLTHMINPVRGLNGQGQPNNVSLYYFNPVGALGPWSSHWTTYQADGSPSIAASYNIADTTKLKVAGESVAFRHSARDANTTDLETTITHPLTDGKPDAVVFVQHVFTQAASANVDEVVGVRYFDGKWRILTEDQTDKLVPVDFNVTVLPGVTP
jgi:hypothetical protein